MTIHIGLTNPALKEIHMQRRNNRSKLSATPKLRISVNVDTIDGYLDGDFPAIGDSVVTAKKVDGQIVAEYGNRVCMKGKHGAHNIHVRTMNSGTRLQFQGSPYAYKYGQNVHTSSSVLNACRIVFKHALKKFQIEHTAEQLQRWNDGDIHLKRVDLAVNFQMESETEARDVLHQVGRQLYENGHSMSRYGSTVYLRPREGKDYQLVFYAKGPQLRTMQRYLKLPGKDQLIEHCERIIRIELRLLSSELRKLGLDKASAWKKETAEQIFKKYIREKLKFLKVTSGPISAEELDGLNPLMRRLVRLHKVGEYKPEVYATRTRQRHTKLFAELGIDIKCPNQPLGSITSLKQYLSPKKVINDPPEWMKEMGLVPLSAKERAARKITLEKPSSELEAEQLPDDDEPAPFEINKPDRFGDRHGRILPGNVR